MMRLFFILCGINLGFAVNAQAVTAEAKPVSTSLTFRETSFDFGKIQQSRPVTHEFEIINSSPDTLKLQNVQASCGCTTPIWKKEPVAPGASTMINVGYNAASLGVFEKPVTILYNGGQTKIITIKGEVFKAPPTSAPQNTSVQLLKQANK